MIKIILLLIITISCSSPPVTLVYTGQRTEDNIYNGTGELSYPDGSTWNGQFVNGKAWIHDIVLLGSFGTIFGTGILAKMTLIIFSIILCLPFVALWAGFGTFLRNFFTSPESSLMLNRVMGFSLFIVAVWLLV